MNHPLNQRISALVAQLPLQRQQLAMHSTTVSQAVRYRLSAPTTLALVAVGGGVLGWCWFGRAPRCDDNSSGADTTPAIAVTDTAPTITAILRQSVWAAAMAYLARSLA